MTSGKMSPGKMLLQAPAQPKGDVLSAWSIKSLLAYPRIIAPHFNGNSFAFKSEFVHHCLHEDLPNI
jgi:hypothetical protein